MRNISCLCSAVQEEPQRALQHWSKTHSKYRNKNRDVKWLG
nr:MAG TPA: hypothetical protein [Caudoviricetes sp.]